MKMKKSICLTIIAIAGLVMACKGTENESQKLAFETKTYESKTKIVDLKLSVDFPTSGNAVLTNAIAEYVSEALGNTLAGNTYAGDVANADSLLNHYGTAVKDSLTAWHEGMPDDMQYVFTTTVKKAYETDSYVTLVTNNEQYTGGAHGMTTESGMTFRKSDGRRLGLEMFVNLQSDELHQLTKEGLKEYFKSCGETVNTDKELKEMLFIDDDVNFLPYPKQPPYLTTEGVTFEYQPYEIAPYAAGLPKFTIPFAKIRPYLTSTVQKMIDERGK